MAPRSPEEALQQAQDFFSPGPTPAFSGTGVRQSRVQNNRFATTTRQLIKWLVPEGPIVEMYVNPKNIVYSDKKIITPQQTKGGFVMQYWGEDLTRLTISGTTGSSGIEGINVLYDLYRYEQLAFEPYALAMAAEKYYDTLSQGVFDSESLLTSPNILGSFLGGSSASTSNFNPPSLADIAFRVEMYYAGWVMRGYFDSFSITEEAENLSTFSYNINFVVTSRRGYRYNNQAWQRSPLNGPSNSDPQVGTPYSYGTLVEADGVIR